MEISDRIKGLRKTRGFSQEYLAELLKVDKHTVGAWERGLQQPGSGSVCALSKVFMVSADELLGLNKIPCRCDCFGLEFRTEFRQEPNLEIERGREPLFGLSDIMEERGISRKALAASLGVTKKTIRNWETKGLPGIQHYQRIFEILNFDIDAFNALR